MLPSGVTCRHPACFLSQPFPWYLKVMRGPSHDPHTRYGAPGQPNPVNFQDSIPTSGPQKPRPHAQGERSCYAILQFPARCTCPSTNNCTSGGSLHVKNVAMPMLQSHTVPMSSLQRAKSIS